MKTNYENEYEIVRLERVENARVLGDWYRSILSNYESYLSNFYTFPRPTLKEIKINPTIYDENE